MFEARAQPFGDMRRKALRFSALRGPCKVGFEPAMGCGAKQGLAHPMRFRRCPGNAGGMQV